MWDRIVRRGDHAGGPGRMRVCVGVCEELAWTWTHTCSHPTSASYLFQVSMWVFVSDVLCFWWANREPCREGWDRLAQWFQWGQLSRFVSCVRERCRKSHVSSISPFHPTATRPPGSREEGLPAAPDQLSWRGVRDSGNPSGRLFSCGGHTTFITSTWVPQDKTQSLPFLCLLVFRKLEASLGGKREKGRQEEELEAHSNVSGRGLRKSLRS